MQSIPAGLTVHRGSRKYMIMKKGYIISTKAVVAGLLVTAGMLVVASCKKESPALGSIPVTVEPVTEGKTDVPDNDGTPIEIMSSWSGEGEGETKGVHQMTNSSIVTDRFGLFAWWNRTDDPFDGTLTGHEWLENAQMQYIGASGGRGRWRCNPPAFWPFGCNLTFFAYAPYMSCTGGMLTLPNGEMSYMPRGTFVQDTDPARQVDFCMTNPVMDRRKADGEVPLEFWHALTRVLFYVNLNAASSETGRLYPDDDHQYRVKSLVLEGIVNSNKFTFSGRNTVAWDQLPRADLSKRAQAYSLSIASGTLAQEPTPFEWDMESYSGLERYKCINGVQSGVLYLLPQPMTSKAKVTMVVSKGYWSGSTWTETDVLDPFVITMPTETVWKPGQTVAYSVSLDITQWEEVEFSVTLLPWGSATDSTTFPV